MNNKRPLAPGFINRLDRYLLLNKPDTWSARTHLVVYYGLLFGIVLGLLYVLVPNDLRHTTNVYAWTFFTALLSAIGFIIWLIYLLRFNVFKRFGVVSKGDKVKSFLLYFLSIGTLVAVVFIPSVVETAAANRAYTTNEIVGDVNKMNLLICQLNYDSMPRNWKSDTFRVRNKVAATAYNDEGEIAEIVDSGHGKDFHIIDTADFRIRTMGADSLIRLDDSTYILFECPDYNFVHADIPFITGFRRTLSSRDIFYQVFKQPAVTDKNKRFQELRALLVKYQADTSQAEEYTVTAAYEEAETARVYSTYNKYHSNISSKYMLYRVNTSLENITSRKYRWEDRNFGTFVRIFYYTTLVLTLLVFIFRQSTIPTFFLTLLTATVLCILTSLLLSLTGTRLAGVWQCCIGYFIFFLVLACLVHYSKTRNVITGISLNLAVFFTVFLPLLVTAFYYQLLKDADSHNPKINFFRSYPNETLHYFYAEVAGAILLLVLIEVLFKPLYRKWYALPEA